MEKSHWLFVEGTQGDANFLVGLQKYVIPTPLYTIGLLFCNKRSRPLLAIRKNASLRHFSIGFTSQTKR